MADCVDRGIVFLFTEVDVDDESLLKSLDITESLNSDEFEEVDNELDAVWDDVSFYANILCLES